MRKPTSNRKGYSLIELVAALVIMGFVGALAGMGLVNIVEGFDLVRRATDSTQKAQFAVARMVKEFTIAESVVYPLSQAGDITFDIRTLSGNETHRFYQQGDAIYFQNTTISAQSYTLTDKVKPGGFVVTYTPSSREISITLSLEDSPKIFSTKVFHRNKPE